MWIINQFFNIIPILQQNLCWKLRSKKYTIPLYDIICCKILCISQECDRNAMLKNHFTLYGKSNSDYLLICQKRNSIISYIVHIWLTCNVEIFVVDNFHRLSYFELIGRSLFWLYNKNSWYNVDIFKYSLKCYKRFYGLFWSHLQLCNWYLLLVNNYLFFYSEQYLLNLKIGTER